MIFFTVNVHIKFDIKKGFDTFENITIQKLISTCDKV